MNPHIFREYDIRGVVDRDLTEETVYRLALAVGTFFRGNNAARVSIGRDARESSPPFRDQFVRGLTETGCSVLDVGMVPTPVLYFTLFTQGCDGGVMITGSHNPADNNGFKICLGKSTIYGSQIVEIREIARKGEFATGAGKVEVRDVLPMYCERIMSDVKLGPRHVKVLVDGGNGMGGIVGGPLYRSMGCEVIELFCEPDSRFPNHHPDPTVVENMRFAIEGVARHGADLAIAFDGDGDRIGVVDEKGRIIWGDQLMVIFSRAILNRRPGATFIAEVKCSKTMFDDIVSHGGNPVMWKVGHSLIKAKMREIGAELAGEMSGHLFFADRYFGFDDAIYAGARLLEILSATDARLSQLIEDLPKTVYTPEIRFECPDELKFHIVQALTKDFKRSNRVIDIDGARIVFEHGWGLVRASNTQPVLVLRFEADNSEHLEEIRNAVESRLRTLMKAGHAG
jgi:phosphomannomutase/phosphoglucomutase